MILPWIFKRYPRSEELESWLGRTTPDSRMPPPVEEPSY